MAKNFRVPFLGFFLTRKRERTKWHPLSGDRLLMLRFLGRNWGPFLDKSINPNLNPFSTPFLGPISCLIIESFFDSVFWIKKRPQKVNPPKKAAWVQGSWTSRDFAYAKRAYSKPCDISRLRRWNTDDAYRNVQLNFHADYWKQVCTTRELQMPNDIGNHWRPSGNNRRARLREICNMSGQLGWFRCVHNMPLP